MEGGANVSTSIARGRLLTSECADALQIRRAPLLTPICHLPLDRRMHNVRPEVPRPLWRATSERTPGNRSLVDAANHSFVRERALRESLRIDRHALCIAARERREAYVLRHRPACPRPAKPCRTGPETRNTSSSTLHGERDSRRSHADKLRATSVRAGFALIRRSRCLPAPDPRQAPATTALLRPREALPTLSSRTPPERATRRAGSCGTRNPSSTPERPWPPQQSTTTPRPNRRSP